MTSLQSNTNKILLIPNVNRRNTYRHKIPIFLHYSLPYSTNEFYLQLRYRAKEVLVMIVTLNETSCAAIWARNPGQVIRQGQETQTCWYTGQSPLFLFKILKTTQAKYQVKTNKTNKYHKKSTEIFRECEKIRDVPAWLLSYSFWILYEHSGNFGMNKSNST